MDKKAIVTALKILEKRAEVWRAQAELNTDELIAQHEAGIAHGYKMAAEILEIALAEGYEAVAQYDYY